ncbi:MAG: hypothetical protein AAF550_05545, partial [Myxococcota bacterium]
PNPVLAESSNALSDPRTALTRTAREDEALGDAGQEPVHPEDPATAERSRSEATNSPWLGPRVELGYVRYRLRDGAGAGVVHALAFGGHFSHRWLRFSLLGEGGSRSYQLGSNDLLARAQVVFGIQRLVVERVMAYANVSWGGGVLIGTRFHSSVSDLFHGIGLEAGSEIRTAGPFWIGAGLGYLRAKMQGLVYHSAVFRIRIGL